jgi:hypothetical protein
LPAGLTRGAGSGFFAMSSTIASSSLGFVNAITTGVATSMINAGIRLKRVKMVSLKGSTCPVSFSTMFIGVP